ncbi:hypothetical protein [Natronobacterium texcoconense]|nr:hypothetical protein [Natronobacterium texcoconense]
MNPYVLPLCSVFVALVAGVQRRSTNLLLELTSTGPSTDFQVLLGGRFAAFVAVYGLLFGLAYLVGTRSTTTVDDVTISLLTGAVAAVVSLVTTGLIDWSLEPNYADPVLGTVALIGSSIGTGVQFAVVAFAGIALARRRT